MTKALYGQYLSEIIGNRFAGVEPVWDEASVWIEPHLVGDVAYFDCWFRLINLFQTPWMIVWKEKVPLFFVG